MSTEYYALRKPITSLRVARRGQYTLLTIFVNHANAGTFTVRNEELPLLIQIFADRDKSVVYCYFAGQNVGMVLRVDEALDAHTQVISEYGKLATVEELRKQS